MSTPRVAAAIALLLTAVPSRHAGAQSPRDEQAIRAARARSNAAIAAHRVAGIVAEMAEDIVVLSSASQLAVGRNANAERFMEQFRDRPGVVYLRTPDSVQVFLPWGMASEWGHWRGSWTAGREVIEIGGAYFAKWHKVPGLGTWQIAGETYVPSWCRGRTFCAERPK